MPEQTTYKVSALFCFYERKVIKKMKENGNKARYWNGVLYPENMIDDWEDEIGYILQLPYAYCKHDKDKNKDGTPRKSHVHVILAFPNTTTYNHALSVLNELSKPGQTAINKVERTKNIRFSYDYLIHDTEDCKKKNKYLYDVSERITGNNFDIGAYEQLSIADRLEIKQVLRFAIKEEGFTNYADFLDYVDDNYEADSHYIEIATEYYNFFEKLTRANFQKWQVLQEYGKENVRYENNTKKSALATRQQHENNTQICCPECGSVNVKKSGKTASLSQRWQCNDCKKTFVF